MNPWLPIIISITAALVSLTSLGFSIYFGLRDRAKLRTSCTLYHPNPDLPWPYPSLSVRVVNAGRRTIVLRNLGGFYGDGRRSSSESLDHEKGGRRLGEHESFERTIRYEADDYTILYLSSEEPEYLRELWVEDTLGQRTTIRNSREAIAGFWKLVRAERARNVAEKQGPLTAVRAGGILQAPDGDNSETRVKREII